MHHLILAGGMAISLLAGPAAPMSLTTTDPPADPVVVEVLSVSGSGCSVGTTAVSTSPDNTSFTVSYSGYMAQVGVGALPTDFRKNCQISLVVHAPEGFTYALGQASHAGYAFLEPGANAQVRTTYYFQGQTPGSSLAHHFAGPMDDSWEITDISDIASTVYAPCGETRNLNANTEIRVNGGTSDTATTTSFITMDLTSAFHFSWKQCA